MNNQTDTIAAVSTAMNNSGIGIIRISGEQAFSIINTIFRPAKKEKDLSAVQSHTIHYGTIMDGDSVVDEVLVLIMKGPHTYTREDTVEIDCHGGMFVINRILELVIRSGARTAEPGEFTKRAFLNGRIDLSQAEAVIDVINAENEYALKSAVTQLKGSVSEKVRQQRAILLENIAYIEAALDDPEHIEMEGYGQKLLPVIESCRNDIDALIRTADDGRILKEGIKTVILGKPNVGKSSLLNALLGTDRAIVTQIPGTTRDALEESVRLEDVTLHIIDTAGIRDTEDLIEKIGVDKARQYAADADLILWVLDGSRPLDQDDREILSLIRGKKTIILVNKQDLPEASDETMVMEQLSAWKDAALLSSEKLPEQKEALQTADTGQDNLNQPVVIGISALQKSGIDVFIQTVRHMFYNKEINFNDQVFITNMRQKEALTAARGSLEKAMESIENDMPEDFFTIDLMDAYTSLGAVIGESLEDDLADEIFAKFCMGK